MPKQPLAEVFGFPLTIHLKRLRGIEKRDFVLLITKYQIALKIKH